jgi:hypothetical protein
LTPISAVANVPSVRLTERATQLIAFTAIVTCAIPAAAQSRDIAESLFQSGKRLLEQERYAEACPKLAESFRADPATGTLLALAMCHEAEGKLGSAWTEYGDVAERARREGRSDRDEAARQFRSALEPRLATLTIEVPASVAEIPGLVVTRDGLPVGAGAWSATSPIDPGTHLVGASAPGRQTWTATVAVHGAGQHARIAVPALVVVATAGLVTTTSAPQAVRSRPPGDPRARGLRIAARVAFGASLVAAGLGTYLGIEALRKNASSASGCAGDVCNSPGLALRSQARRAGDASTISFAATGVLLGGGLGLYFGARF